MLLSAQKIIEIPDFRRPRLPHADRRPGGRRPEDARPTGAAACSTRTDMMTMLHRVVFYGNHVENVEHLAHLMGLKVVMEG